MGFFKIKKIIKNDNNQVDYDITKSFIKEERLELPDAPKKTTIRKSYSVTNESEPYTNKKTILIKKGGPIDPKKIFQKKGTSSVNEVKVIEKPFDNKFIGVNNERTEKIAVLVHCYFIDVLVQTILPSLLPLAKYADFYFNFIKNNDTNGQTMAIEVIKSNFDNYTINYTNRNIGRDINGQFNNLKKIYENDKTYDFYLLLHTKKSVHMVRSDAQYWLLNLLKGTVGDYDKINQILDCFKNNEKIGIIGSEDKKLRTLKDSFELNADNYNELCRLLKIDKNINSYFIAGTMFWIRSEILDHYLRKKNILKLLLSKLEENKLIDGDWHHAMERLYGTLCYNLGYTVND